MPHSAHILLGLEQGIPYVVNLCQVEAGSSKTSTLLLELRSVTRSLKARVRINGFAWRGIMSTRGLGIRKTKMCARAIHHASA